MQKKILVTGGAGFIGSNYVVRCAREGNFVVNLDLLTYSGNLVNLSEVQDCPDQVFHQGDIGDEVLVGRLLDEYSPDYVVNFAAETHVDRSIADPQVFFKTNVLATEALLRTTLKWWKRQPSDKKRTFRFLHISTDEVYGSLKPDDPAFTEESNYRPNSPYSASKASSDMIVRAYHETYGLPTLITNCSNNYGPKQYPEKLIPVLITRALSGQSLPIYGDGMNIRDWLYVEDHCAAISAVLKHGRQGQAYNIGGNQEKTNLEVVRTVCRTLDELMPSKSGLSYADQIRFVEDRPGHDARYAINCTKLTNETGWRPSVSFEDGIRRTIDWYLGNRNWTDAVMGSEWKEWMRKNYSWREQR